MHAYRRRALDKHYTYGHFSYSLSIHFNWDKLPYICLRVFNNNNNCVLVANVLNIVVL